jgi:hypothetical protein
LFEFNKLRFDSGLNVPSNTLRTLDQNYPEALQPLENKQLSVIQEPDIKYEETVYYLNINSNDRNATTYPLQYSYTINLDKVYNNVVCVEMISAIFPNVSGIILQPYLVYDIEELNTIDFALTSQNHKGFAICPLKNPNQSSGGFVLTELGCAFHTKTVYKIPKKISRLTVKIKDMYGNIYNFGDSSGTGSTAQADQNAFVLKITCNETSRKPLNLRNVF